MDHQQQVSDRANLKRSAMNLTVDIVASERDVNLIIGEVFAVNMATACTTVEKLTRTNSGFLSDSRDKNERPDKDKGQGHQGDRNQHEHRRERN